MRLWRLLLVGLIVGAPLHAETVVLFSSQNSVERQLVERIDRAQSQIDLALFLLRSARLIRALREADARGVRMRIVLDSTRRGDKLALASIRWLGGIRPRGRGVMHNKFAIFDQTDVVTGSYNWTVGAEYANYENVLLIDEANIVRGYQEEFERLWQRAGLHPAPLPRPAHQMTQKNTPSVSRFKRSRRVRIKIRQISRDKPAGSKWRRWQNR